MLCGKCSACQRKRCSGRKRGRSERGNVRGEPRNDPYSIVRLADTTSVGGPVFLSGAPDLTDDEVLAGINDLALVGGTAAIFRVRLLWWNAAKSLR